MLIRFGDFRSLGSFGSLNNFKFHDVAFFQPAKTFANNCGIVHKNIGTIFAANKSKSLGIVKPLHRPFQLRPFNCDVLSR